jgi:6-pyruvoyltetrahydropterin/6-carboxytetrahydropterin synthase
MSNFISTKVIELGSCAFRQWAANDSRPHAGENPSRCGRIHGYQLKAKFWFGCKELDNKGWGVDFGSLKGLKETLNYMFDHTLTVAGDDPLLPLFQELHDKGGCDLRVMPDGVGIERAAEYCFHVADDIINEQYGDRCWVEKVEVFEHDRNSAIYANPYLQQEERKSIVTPSLSELLTRTGLND